MKAHPPALRPGCYRLTSTVRIIPQPNGGLALCSYPLRVLRLSTLTASLLLHCREQQTCEQLAQHLNLPTQHVQTLCEQLRWKELLEAGPTLPPITWPSISIIIPTRNRAQQHERCLTSLLALDYPSHCLEIIIVDDASTDHTTAMLQHFVQQAIAQGITIQIIRHTHQQGVAISRNTGVKAAQHDLLAFIDSDCIASPVWLAELVPAFQDTQLGAVGGMIRAYERHSMLGRYEDTRSSLFMGTRPQQIRLTGPLTYLPTANLLLRKTIWHKLGGFAPLTFGEDVDFCYRLLATDSTILYLPQGIVYHDYRTTLPAFLRTRISYASSEAALLQRHPTQRRTLLLPPEQATIATSLLTSAWLSAVILGKCTGRLITNTADNYSSQPRSAKGFGKVQGCHAEPFASLEGELREESRCPAGKILHCAQHDRAGMVRERSLSALVPLIITLLLINLLLTLLGTHTRWQKVHQHNIPLNPLTIFLATLRGHLAYTYHLCRHLTRYYTLTFLAISLLLPPIFLLILTLYSIVIGVDYIRLHPQMNLAEYVLCSLLDDCAYEIGIIVGCIKHKTWKPLLPIINFMR
jgi:mycofactocin system glycosyltransferase